MKWLCNGKHLRVYLAEVVGQKGVQDRIDARVEVSEHVRCDLERDQCRSHRCVDIQRFHHQNHLLTDRQSM